MKTTMPITSVVAIAGLTCLLSLMRLSARGEGGSPNPAHDRGIMDQAILDCLDNDVQNDIRKVAIELMKVKERSKLTETMSPLSKFDRVHLVQQVLLFSRAGAQGEEEGYGAMVLFGELRPSNEELVSAVASWIDTSDPRFRKMIRDILWEIDSERQYKSKGVMPDYTWYESWIAGHTNASAVGLIRYMYGRSPDAALMSMARVYGTKTSETEVLASLKGDPKAALQSLADRPEWWVHLYVAETMKKQPQLRDAVILKRLETDGHPLVKEKVAEITSEN